MSRRDDLNLYIASIERRLRLLASVRGAAVIAGVALVATLLLTLILNAYAFPEHALRPARLILLALLLAAAAIGLAMPLLRLTRRRSIDRAEARFPDLEQRLLTFSERERANDPFLELLAADTLKVAHHAPAHTLVPSTWLLALAGAAAAGAGLLLWMVVAGPGYLGYGASLLWTGPKPHTTPIYDIRVTPGDAAVRRHSDEMVTAQLVGLDAARADLHVRYGSASKWEPVAMKPQPGRQGFQFLLVGLPEDVEYYVGAGPVESRHYTLRVVDLPAVKSIQVTYHYPRWTGMREVSDEQGGDLRALEGTDAELTVVMDSSLQDGLLVLDNGQPLHLTGGDPAPGGGNRYHGTIHMQKDGAYHVAGLNEGQQVRLSEDFFISTSNANPPQIAIDRPGKDYRASPIEEVTIGVKASAEFGLSHASLHYSVNGGPEQEVNLLDHAGAKSVSGTTTLRLEDFKMVPGDVVSLYATAKDAHAETRTEISFIQAEPFERQFSQSQQGGGGGGSGGQGQGDQTDISRREKELIAATWKQQNERSPTAQQAADVGKVLSEAQVKLREQALALSVRMQSRDLSSANEEFTSFEKDMQQAAAAMVPSADKLKALAWRDALPQEQKALQALLRAEATFREIQVAFGQQSGGGGGGGGSAGRDLASLFDLEMDTEKNQYETAQTGSAAEQQAKKIDDALEKLDALAKRQEELAQQQQGNQAQSFEQRWQQEMLLREAEELQRQMEQMQGGQQSAGTPSGQGSQGKAGSQGKSGSQSSSQAGGQAGSPGREPGSQQGGRQARDGGADPRVQQALNRLRAANEEMKRAGGSPQSGSAQNGQPSGSGQRSSSNRSSQSSQSSQPSAAEARRAAEQLREATNLLGGAQKQQASGRLDSLAREAARLSKEENAQAERIHSLIRHSGADPDGTGGGTGPATPADRNKLIDDRQRLSDDLAHLQRGLRDTARELAPNQPATAAKLREALSGMDQGDLGNRVQRTADWLRRNINPESNGTEGEVAAGLKQLKDQVQQAQQGMGAGGRDAPGKTTRGTETAALDHVDRLRSELQSLSAARPGQQGRQGPGQPGPSGQAGTPKGQGSGQQGRGQGQQGGGQGQQGKGAQNGPGGGQQRGGQQGGGNNGGSPQVDRAGDRSDLSGDRVRGGGGGTAVSNVNTGDNRFDPNAKHAGPTTAPAPADSERIVRQGLQELNQLRQLAGNDPAAQREIRDLIKEMQHLDPSRFPGNPAMVEDLHTQVLHDVDKLELQLRRNEVPQPGQVRTTKAPTVPPGYEDAVADYYRRLGKGQ